MAIEWDPELYLKFRQERTQPSIDLVHRIEVADPASILDVGCGPGNSTAVLARRWPQSAVMGIDNSAEMIEKARESNSAIEWVLGDVRELSSSACFDIVYSNAALQWLPDHESVVADLFARVTPGGALAVQVPMDEGMPIRQILRTVAQNERWRERVAGAAGLLEFHDPGFYYDLLSPRADRLSIWKTAYLHELESQAMIVEMIRSTSMHPYLERLPTEEERDAFTAGVLEGIRREYPVQANGRVLFAFHRLFFIAYRR